MVTIFVEGLESRCLMSAVGPATVFNAAVRADQLHVFQDFTKFKKDGISSTTKMLRDAKRINSSNLSQAPTAKSLISTLEVSLLQGHAALAEDHLTDTKAVLADEKAILAETKKLAHDQAKGNSAAVTADQAQLTSDRTQVKTDIDAELQARFTDRENLFNTILTNASNLTAAITADTQASNGLKAASQQLTTDSTNCGTVLSADLQQAGTDATQLDTDLTASE
jgi:hypothetical protein